MDEWKEKYEALQGEFEAFRALTEKRGRFKTLLERARVDPRRHEAIMRLTNWDEVALEDEGQALSQIEREWADFIPEEKGVPVAQPPQSGRVMPTKAEILAISDTRERQRAISENHELFGF